MRRTIHRSGGWCADFVRPACQRSSRRGRLSAQSSLDRAASPSSAGLQAGLPTLAPKAASRSPWEPRLGRGQGVPALRRSRVRPVPGASELVRGAQRSRASAAVTGRPKAGPYELRAPGGAGSACIRVRSPVGPVLPGSLRLRRKSLAGRLALPRPRRCCPADRRPGRMNSALPAARALPASGCGRLSAQSSLARSACGESRFAREAGPPSTAQVLPALRRGRPKAAPTERGWRLSRPGLSG